MDVNRLPPAEGKFASTVKVGAKGQIVIPKGARDLFGIEPGDTLLLLADAQQGMTIMRQEVLDKFLAETMRAPAEETKERASQGEEPA